MLSWIATLKFMQIIWNSKLHKQIAKQCLNGYSLPHMATHTRRPSSQVWDCPGLHNYTLCQNSIIKVTNSQRKKDKYFQGSQIIFHSMLTCLVQVLSSKTIFNARTVKLALTVNRVNWDSDIQSFLHRDALLSSQCERVFQVPILYTWSPVCNASSDSKAFHRLPL